MKVSAGKVVKYIQINNNHMLGSWGQMEIEAMFPDQIPHEIQSIIEGKSIGEVVIFEKKPGRLQRENERVIKVPIKKMITTDTLKKGTVYSAQLSGSASYTGVVTDFSDEFVTLDCNQPDIGKTSISITITGIREPAENETSRTFTVKKVFI